MTGNVPQKPTETAYMSSESVLWLAPPQQLPHDLATLRAAAHRRDRHHAPPDHRRVPERRPREAVFDEYFAVARCACAPALLLIDALDDTLAKVRALSRNPDGTPTEPDLELAAHAAGLTPEATPVYAGRTPRSANAGSRGTDCSSPSPRPPSSPCDTPSTPPRPPDPSSAWTAPRTSCAPVRRPCVSPRASASTTTTTSSDPRWPHRTFRERDSPACGRPITVSWCGACASGAGSHRRSPPPCDPPTGAWPRF